MLKAPVPVSPSAVRTNVVPIAPPVPTQPAAPSPALLAVRKLDLTRDAVTPMFGRVAGTMVNSLDEATTERVKEDLESRFDRGRVLKETAAVLETVFTSEEILDLAKSGAAFTLPSVEEKWTAREREILGPLHREQNRVVEEFVQERLEEQTRTVMEELLARVQMFREDFMDYPKNMEDLVAMSSPAQRVYLQTGEQFLDGWDRAVTYERDADRARIISSGPLLETTDDDIVIVLP